MFSVSSVNIIRFLSPIRYLEFILLFSLIPVFKIPWQSAIMMLDWFFPIIGISIFYEAIFDDEKNFWTSLKKNGWKYYVTIGMQYVGMAVFARTSFNSDPDKVLYIAIISLVVFFIGLGLEMFHKFTTNKFRDIKLSSSVQVLILIAFTVLIFLYSLYTYFYLLPQTEWWDNVIHLFQ